jgi:hypothetical protein
MGGACLRRNSKTVNLKRAIVVEGHTIDAIIAEDFVPFISYYLAVFDAKSEYSSVTGI